VEAAVLTSALGALATGQVPGDPVSVTAPGGGRARVAIRGADGGAGGHDGAEEVVSVEVWAGDPVDPVVLRSYCIGAVHQALGWVRSEGVAVDDGGLVQDLTIRSFGVLPARDLPWVEVTVHAEDRWPVNGSDAVFAATAVAAWIADGLAQDPPVGLRVPCRPTVSASGGGVGRSGAPAGGAGAGVPAVGPYRPAVRAGAWVVTSGQIGIVPGPDGSPWLVEGGTAAEVRQALANLASVLATQGASLAHVVKATVFLVDMADFAAVGEAWAEAFPDPRPARSAVGVAALPMGARVEVEAWARLPED
jgi:2-iminobutanoate/2-iminopropanoate deaminase